MDHYDRASKLVEQLDSKYAEDREHKKGGKDREWARAVDIATIRATLALAQAIKGHGDPCPPTSRGAM